MTSELDPLSDWRNLVDKTLAGADFHATLVSQTLDGLCVAPLYALAESEAPLVLPSRASWQVCVRMDHPDPEHANALSLEEIAGGANGLSVVVEGAPSAHGFGVSIADCADLDRALGEVDFGTVALRFEPGSAGALVASLLPRLADRRAEGLDRWSVDLGLDPIGVVAAGGSINETAELAADYRTLVTLGFTGRGFAADGRVVHAAGGSEAQELAFVLASGVAVLRALEADIPLDAARRAIGFTLAADADLFLTVAKFRALRRLWARIEEACGLGPEPIALHAETAWRMVTTRDPTTNLLRATLATAGAAMGGANSIAVLPHTSALGLPDAAARRMARNIGLVLRDEAFLGRVSDPLAGSGAFESWTVALAARAWDLFGAIEHEGGIAASLSSGAFQTRVGAIRQERDKRPPSIVGTTIYADPQGRGPNVLMPARADPADDDTRLMQSRRVAAPFEPKTDAAA